MADQSAEGTIEGTAAAEAAGTTGRAEPLARQIDVRMRDGLHLASLLTVGAVHCGLALPVLLSHLDTYPRPALHLASFALLSAVLVAETVQELRGRRRSRPWVWTMVTATFAASLTATSQLHAESFAGAHWSFLEVGWFGVVLLLDRPRTTTWLFLGCHLAATAAQLLLAGVPSRSAAAGMAVSVLAICTFQMAAALAVRLLADRATRASATLREQERIRTSAAVAAHIHTDQRARYRDLDTTVLPLIAGLADGSLDPREESVRRRCALEAARLRRLFAEHDYAADPLVHELRACIDVAERNGVSVHLAVRGDPVEVPRPVRQALTEPVLAALAAARRTARTTVVRGAGQVRVGVVIDRPEAQSARAASQGVRTRAVSDDGRLWVESVYTLADTDDGTAAAQSSSSEIRPS
ncbi:hypothetical protein [Streptomyces sp. SAI-229]|uniref:hypothetical protein n=1 Tax=Streptomyces sp. SAI-229 TaxID=3377731 RepID=UPI003C7A2DBE